MQRGLEGAVIVTFGSEKGGVGKSTLAVNMAVLRARAGASVLLVDADRQQSATFWAGLRQEAGHLPSIAVMQLTGDIRQQAVKLSKQYDAILLDVPGRDAVEMRAAIMVSDVLVIPTRASQFDAWALETMQDLITAPTMTNSKLRPLVVVNAVSTNPLVKEAAELEALLGGLSHLGMTHAIIRDRIAWRRAAGEGLAVVELKPQDAKATAEAEALYLEVFA